MFLVSRGPSIQSKVRNVLNELTYRSKHCEVKPNLQLRQQITNAKKNLCFLTTGNAFNKMMRSAFLAFLKNFMGEPHVAKFVIRHGVGPADATSLFGEFLEELVALKAERRSRQEERSHPHGAAEPVWKLRRAALSARHDWRRGRRLSSLDYGRLDTYAQRLVDEWWSGALAVRVDRANKAYGHGIARTHDFGFEPGQNMCTQIPADIAAAVRRLRAGARAS